MRSEDRLDENSERACYEQHHNDPADERYRAFLDRLATPLGDHLAPGNCGLDYGSGPGPTLSKMLTERGFPTVEYDPFFAPFEERLQRRYHFVTCTETAEHFYNPAREFELLDSLLEPGGVLAVMTTFRTEATNFDRWGYVRDITHVCFYSEQTMLFIARWRGFTATFPAQNVVIFRKGDADLRS